MFESAEFEFAHDATPLLSVIFLLRASLTQIYFKAHVQIKNKYIFF